MESTIINSVLDRVQRVSRNAEKMLAFECKHIQARLDSLPLDSEDRVRALRSIADCVDQMREKIEDCMQAKDKFFLICEKRQRFLEEACRDDPGRFLDFLLCEYLSRRGYLQSAKMLASLSELTDLVDVGIFEQHRQIVDALNAHNTGPALNWCQVIKPRLLTSGKLLEFHLHLREFVELVKKRDFTGAIEYARVHLLAEFEAHTDLMKRHLGLLAFLDQASLCRQNQYSDLLEDSCWDTVRDLFSKSFFQLHKFSPDPQLDLFLKTGLCALKSQSCGTPNRIISDCPVCSPDVTELAANLQAAPKTMSCLVCRLTGDVMDESNPPMVVPNGRVYSKAGLHSLALVNGGSIRCPETGSTFNLSQCKNVFVL